MSEEADRGRNAAALLVDAPIAATEGNRRALIYRDKTYTFQDLAALVNRAGNVLRSAGVERGGRALILLSPSPVMFGLMLGAMKVGAAAVMMDGSPDADSVRAACGRHAPAVAIVDGARLDELHDALGKTRSIVAGEPRDDSPSLVDLLRAAPSSLAAEAVADASVALIVIGGGGAASATHAQLADAGQGKPLPSLRLGRLDLSAALALLAECKEVAIPAAATSA